MKRKGKEGALREPKGRERSVERSVVDRVTGIRFCRILVRSILRFARIRFLQHARTASTSAFGKLVE